MTVAEAIQTVVIDKLKKLVIDNDMVATRALLNSIRYEKNESFGQEAYDIIALDYIIGLNDGVAPGETPYPSIEDIQTWIDAKGLDLNPYAVRNSIIANGTTWYRQGGSNIVTDSINDETLNEVIKLAEPEIKNNIAKTWQSLFTKNP